MKENAVKLYNDLLVGGLTEDQYYALITFMDEVGADYDSSDVRLINGLFCKVIVNHDGYDCI